MTSKSLNATKSISRQLSSLATQTSNTMIQHAASMETRLLDVSSGISNSTDILVSFQQEFRRDIQQVMSQIKTQVNAHQATLPGLTNLSSVSRRSGGVQAQRQAQTVGTVKTRFGRLIFTITRSRKRFSGQYDCGSTVEVAATFFLPGQWFRSIQGILQFSTASWGFNARIGIRNRVPQDHPAFQLVQEGDTEGLLRLLNDGAIGIRDTQQYVRSATPYPRPRSRSKIEGGTLLHVRTCALFNSIPTEMNLACGFLRTL